MLRTAGQTGSGRKGFAMDNLPMIIVGSLSVLFLILVVLYVLFQKKQDKKDAEHTREMLETLKIDIKNATDDEDLIISDDSDVAEVEQESPPHDSQVFIENKPDHSENSADEAESLRGVDEKTEYAAEKSASAIGATDNAEDVFYNEPKDSADLENGEEDDADLIIKDATVPVQQPLKPKTKQADGVSIDDDIFEMIESANVQSAESDTAENDDTFDLDTYVKETIKTESPPVDAKPKTPDTSADNGMDELDALFQATQAVEDKLLTKNNKAKEKHAKNVTVTDTSYTATKPEPDSNTAESRTPIPDKSSTEPIKIVEPNTNVESDQPDRPRFDPENQKRHDKAKRIARVIVNDIRNYNPENLAEGIRIGNIMKTLGKEVERGRLLYIKRVPHEIVKETNYYREALLNILADGQSNLLGL
jgi:hypothetical protein